MTLHERYKQIAAKGHGVYVVPTSTTKHNMLHDLNTRYLASTRGLRAVSWGLDRIKIVCACCGR